jgi:hypothetical protein
MKMLVDIALYGLGWLTLAVTAGAIALWWANGAWVRRIGKGAGGATKD